MITVNFYGYTTHTDTMRKAQMIEAQATREAESGDIDAWFYAGCPIGPGYAKWEAERVKPKNPAAVALGRKGGAAKVRKGFATLSPERRADIAAKAVAARRAKSTADAPTPAEPPSTRAGR